MDYICTYNGESTLDMIGIFIISPLIQTLCNVLLDVQSSCSSITKSFKSTEPKKGNLDEKPTRRRYSPEEDQRHVSVQCKNRSSLKHIAEILDGSINSVIDRCFTFLSSNGYVENTNRMDLDYGEYKNFVFNKTQN